jgi:hypothetical protein
MPTVPTDGRPQFDPSTVWVANAMAGRWITDGVETMTPGGKYILQNSWPKPRPSTGGFSGVAASLTAPESVGPKSSAGARAIWPTLP